MAQKKINKIIRHIYLLLFFIIGGIYQSYAFESIAFGPEETKIVGSIPYTVLGNYRAGFKSIKGKIVLDDHLQSIKSVDLEIKVASITSNCPWCDKLVRSHRLLNSLKYPKITFKSDAIIHDEKGYHVKGVLEMHGVKKEMVFPFIVSIFNDRNKRRKLLNINGAWVINRKDFNIIWNRLLDRGGVLVGDYFTVDWKIKLPIDTGGV